MHRSYVTVVEPVVEALRPSVIAEIGTGEGRLTARLLRAPGAAQAHLHAVDPAPAFVPPTAEAFRVTLHREPGLRVLERLGPVDLLLVDADPNWHTVMRTLTLAAAAAREAGQLPPVAVVHNVHWPFGRRDGYHDPDAVPSDARRPYAAAGLDPASSAPDPDGLRLVPFVASVEFGERNGVLTAVEDFAREDPDTWELVDVPGFGGTAVLLAASRLEDQPALRALAATLRTAEMLQRAARRIEAGRVDAELHAARGRAAECGTEPAPAGAELEAVTHARDALVEELAAAAARAGRLEDELAGLRVRTSELDAEVRALGEHRAGHEAALWRVELLERDLAAREQERREAVAARERLAETLATAQADAARAAGELEAARAALAAADTAAEAQAARIEELAQTERLLGGRVLHLEDMAQAARADLEAERAGRAEALSALQEARVDAAAVAVAIRAIRETRRVRAAHALRRAGRRLLLRGPAPSRLDAAVALADRLPALPGERPDAEYAGQVVLSAEGSTVWPRRSGSPTDES